MERTQTLLNKTYVTWLDLPPNMIRVKTCWKIWWYFCRIERHKVNKEQGITIAYYRSICDFGSFTYLWRKKSKLPYIN